LLKIKNIRLSTNLVAKQGYKVKKVNLSEFIKAGGGAHCPTGDLTGI
jgi:N-dimethylarginine dimethylaminohydrolase